MMAMPSGASGCSTSHRWIRKRLPASHVKVVIARGASLAFGRKVGVIRHCPINGSRSSSSARPRGLVHSDLLGLEWWQRVDVRPDLAPSVLRRHCPPATRGWPDLRARSDLGWVRVLVPLDLLQPTIRCP